MSVNSGTDLSFSRPFSVEAIPEAGLSGHIEANVDERAALAEEFEIVKLDSLVCDYEITPRSRGRYHVTGQWRAKVTQTCVVTLDPIETTLGEEFSVDFWPQEDIDRDTGRAEDITVDPLAEAPEPIENRMIDIGRLIAEFVAVSLEPYPRKPDATFTWKDKTSAGSQGQENPFAALSKLKQARNTDPD